MPDDTSNPPPPLDAATVAEELASRLDAAGCEYAFGGAIALGYWTIPRGTMDVDVTLFLPLSERTRCIRLLQQLDCEFKASAAETSLREHGFCQVRFLGFRVDVFLPSLDFHEAAKLRRRQVPLGGRQTFVWDAETLCVFKMMFFRPKDLVDVQAILRTQGANLDRAWVGNALVELYGQRDPRISQWRELAAET
jgi:hypothetical protein